MDADRKRELKSSYKNKPATGGVCRTRCAGSGREWIQATRNIEGLKNRFDFAIATKSAPDPSMRAEWTKYGPDSFSFEVLEQLTKGDNQTDEEFAADINTLHEMWQEKLRQPIIP